MSIRKIGFVTDSTADIPPELVEKHRITVVPTYVNFGSTSVADDGTELDRKKFYDDLAHINPYPTTSAMSPGVAEEKIMQAAEDMDHLFIIAVSSRLSGVYNAMRLGANKLPPERVTLIDSGTTTMGMGFQVLIGAETAEQTQSIEATRDVILRVQRHQHVYAALETLEYLRRSGRVGWAAAGIGTLLQIKPVLSVQDGEVISIARVRTFSRAMDEVFKLAESQQPLDRVCILYAGETEVVNTMREHFAPLAQNGILISRVTPSIGVHIGSSGVGIATLNSAWRT